MNRIMLFEFHEKLMFEHGIKNFVGGLYNLNLEMEDLLRAIPPEVATEEMKSVLRTSLEARRFIDTDTIKLLFISISRKTSSEISSVSISVDYRSSSVDECCVVFSKNKLKSTDPFICTYLDGSPIKSLYQTVHDIYAPIIRCIEN